jgi:hypothetical protein
MKINTSISSTDKFDSSFVNRKTSYVNALSELISKGLVNLKDRPAQFEIKLETKEIELLASAMKANDDKVSRVRWQLTQKLKSAKVISENEEIGLYASKENTLDTIAFKKI